MATPTTLPSTFVSGAVLTAAQMNDLRGAFRVLQVVSTTKTDTFTTSSTSYTVVTGLTASITPSATSSKILVIVNMYGFGTDGGNQLNVQLFRDSTAICIGDTAGSRARLSGNLQAFATGASQQINQTHFNFLDSPNTISAVTYAPYVKVSTAGTGYVNRSQSDTDGAGFVRMASTITVMEISA
jgi:hypothetical protein